MFSNTYGFLYLYTFIVTSSNKLYALGKKYVKSPGNVYFRQKIISREINLARDNKKHDIQSVLKVVKLGGIQTKNNN